MPERSSSRRASSLIALSLALALILFAVKRSTGAVPFQSLAAGLDPKLLVSEIRVAMTRSIQSCSSLHSRGSFGNRVHPGPNCIRTKLFEISSKLRRRERILGCTSPTCACTSLVMRLEFGESVALLIPFPRLLQVPEVGFFALALNDSSRIISHQL